MEGLHQRARQGGRHSHASRHQTDSTRTAGPARRRHRKIEHSYVGERPRKFAGKPDRKFRADRWLKRDAFR